MARDPYVDTTGERADELRLEPTRFVSPFRIFNADRARIEPIHQPLYSSVLLDTVCGLTVIEFFQYASSIGFQPFLSGGANVPFTNVQLPGVMATNMVTPGRLPTPRCFLATGLRTVYLPAPPMGDGRVSQSEGIVIAGPTYTGSPSIHAAQLRGIITLTYASTLRFVVGGKTYLEGPGWLFPGNTGIFGSGNSNLHTGGRTPTQQATLQQFDFWQAAGRYMALDRYPVLIPPEQQFGVTLSLPTAISIGTDACYYVVLDGVLGREVE